MWDVLPDGQAFLMFRVFSQPRTAVTPVQNWFTKPGKSGQQALARAPPNHVTAQAAAIWNV